MDTKLDRGKQSQQPGYRTRGRAGQAQRRAHLSRQPLCVMCLEVGRVTIAREIDHIIALTNGGTDIEENKQSLCLDCHRAKTLVDLGIPSKAVNPNIPRWRLAERAPQIMQQQRAFSELRFPSDITASRIPCVMVCGPPNGGKHAYVREHAGPSDVVIDMDAITPTLSDMPVYEVGVEWLSKALTDRNRQLRALAHDTQHKHAWFLINAPYPDERAQWAERLGATVVLLAPPLEECIRRIKAEPYHAGYTERMLVAAAHWWELNQHVLPTT